jgi:hypothetical protein
VILLGQIEPESDKTKWNKISNFLSSLCQSVIYLPCWVVYTQLVWKCCVCERDLQVGPLKADFWCIGLFWLLVVWRGRGGAEAMRGCVALSRSWSLSLSLSPPGSLQTDSHTTDKAICDLRGRDLLGGARQAPRNTRPFTAHALGAITCGKLSCVFCSHFGSSPF